MEGQRSVCHCTIHRSSSFPHDQGEKAETSNEGSSEKFFGGFHWSVAKHSDCNVAVSVMLDQTG